MTFKLLTEQHLEFLSFKGGSTGLSESTLVKMRHCWKSCVTAHLMPMGKCYMKERRCSGLVVECLTRDGEVVG